MKSKLKELEEIVEHQANIDSLWINNPTITEYLLMAALRHLHAIIQDADRIAMITKKIYWDLEEEHEKE